MIHVYRLEYIGDEERLGPFAANDAGVAVRCGHTLDDVLDAVKRSGHLAPVPDGCRHPAGGDRCGCRSMAELRTWFPRMGALLAAGDFAVVRYELAAAHVSHGGLQCVFRLADAVGRYVVPDADAISYALSGRGRETSPAHEKSLQFDLTT